MGLFSRKPKQAETTVDNDATEQDPGNAVEEISARTLTAEEAASVAEQVEQARALGCDVDSLASISATYDAVLTRPLDGSATNPQDVEAIAAAVGEYLARHGGYRWAMITDSFGTDIGVESKRGSATVIPHNLVATRWMREESGWVERVVEHLARVAQSR